MVSLSEQSKETAESLLNLVNTKVQGGGVGENASSYDLLVAIFKIMVRKENDKLLQEHEHDDKNDSMHFKKQQRHEEILQALGVSATEIPKREEFQFDGKKLDLKKMKGKKGKLNVKLPSDKKMDKESGLSTLFSLGTIATVGKAALGLGAVGAGVMLGKNALAKTIGKGESFGGDPNAFNRPVGGKYVAGRGNIPGTSENVSQMKVGQIRQLQSEGKLFAVGKFQMIPKTLQAAIDAGKVSLNDVFDETTQDRLFDFLIAKRPKAQSYLNGDPNVSRDVAIAELAKEWASIGVPYDMQGANRMVKKGESYYAGDGINVASISPEEVGNVIDSYRNERIQALSNLIKDPSQIGTNINDISQENELNSEILSSNNPVQNVINNNYSMSTTESSKRNVESFDDVSAYERKSSRR